MKLTMTLIYLSIILLVAAIIYANYKKKNYDNRLKKQGLIPEKQNKKSNKNIADILDIQIKDKFVKTGNRYSIILRLGSIDYNMLSDDEQEAIENVLVQTALSINYPIQFFNTTENIDTSKIIYEMEHNEIDSYMANSYKMYMINYLKNLMESKNITVVRNYAILSYDGFFEDAQTELIRICNSFKGNLLRAKIQCELLEEMDLYNLIYRELNKSSKAKIILQTKGVNNLYVGRTKKTKKTKE